MAKSKHRGGGGASKGKTTSGPHTGLKMSNESRADVRKKPSHKNHYPRGLS